MSNGLKYGPGAPQLWAYQTIDSNVVLLNKANWRGVYWPMFSNREHIDSVPHKKIFTAIQLSAVGECVRTANTPRQLFHVVFDAVCGESK